MKNHQNTNSCLFMFEICTYTICTILFMLMFIWDYISPQIANWIYIIYMSLTFGYLFTLEFFLKKYDNAVHYKMFNKYFIPTQYSIKKESYKRRGICGVIILWICYLLFIGILGKTGFLTWQIFLIGANIIFIFNSIFTRKICLLSVFVLKNKNNCCKNCGINCWDYAIFASALIFAPKLSMTATILNIVIVAISITLLVMWEYKYHKYPERFYPETNASLQCKNCLKQCKRTFKNEK